MRTVNYHAKLTGSLLLPCNHTELLLDVVMDFYLFSSFIYLGFNLLSNRLSGYLVSIFQFNSECPTQLFRIFLLDSGGCTDLFNSTFLLLGLINCEFPTALVCRLFCNVAPINICYRMVFFVLPLKAICRLWNPIPRLQVISYLSTYT